MIRIQKLGAWMNESGNLRLWVDLEKEQGLICKTRDYP
jgi:hypothetical protein